MAAEAMQAKYLFLPLNPGLDAENTAFSNYMEHLKLKDEPSPTKLSAPDRPKPPPPFRHNCLHDVESMWWCAVYLLFFNRLEKIKETDEQIKARQKMTAKVFPEVHAGNDHRDFLTDFRFRGDALWKLTWKKRNEFSQAISKVMSLPVKRWLAPNHKQLNNKLKGFDGPPPRVGVE